MFLQRLDELITIRGITKNKLFTDLGINKNAFVAWRERGTIPGGDTLSKIADYFGVSIDYLLGRDEKPAGESGGLSEEAIELITLYDQGTPELRAELLGYARGLAVARKSQDAQKGGK